MTSAERPSAAPSLIRLDLLRLTRDGKSAIVLAAIFAVSLWGAEVRLVLTSVGLLFLPVVVGWSWGADLETGDLVPLSLAVDGRVRLAASRLALLGAVSLAAFSPAWLALGSSPRDRLFLAEAIVAELLLGFLFVSATRSSHAGWIPMLLTLVGVFIPSLRMMRADPGFHAPRWLWLVASALSPQWAGSLSPERRAFVPAVLLVEIGLVGATTAAILRLRANALGRRT